MESDKPSQFLDLPAELRSMIYEQVFANGSMFLVYNYPAPPPTLLLANKQIYLEAVKIYHRVTKFYIDGPRDINMLANIAFELRDAITCVRLLDAAWTPAYATAMLRLLHDQIESDGITLVEGVIRVLRDRSPGGLAWISALGEVAKPNEYEKETSLQPWVSHVMKQREVSP